MTDSPLTTIREFLTFKLGAEEYGIDILRTQEIRSFEAPTRMANSPAFILGVVNLRGLIVPVVDLRIRFKLPDVNYDESTVVIVLHIGEQILGMVVDAVSDVITLTPDQLRPVPGFSSVMGNDHLLAIGSLENRTLMLLDIERLMRSPDMGLIEASR